MIAWGCGAKLEFVKMSSLIRECALCINYSVIPLKEKLARGVVDREKM